MHTIAFLNRKGGVGKTSSCFHLAGALAADGRRVLLIDNDPQACLTQGIFGLEATLATPLSQTVASLFGEGAVPNPIKVIRNTGFENIKIVSGSDELIRWNLPFRPDTKTIWKGSQYAIRSLVRDMEGEFDFTIIDCPPNLHLCSWAALTASDHVVIPFQADTYGSDGIDRVTAEVQSVQSTTNPRLNLLGYLITMFEKRAAVHAAYQDRLRKTYSDQVFEAVVPRAKDFKEAVTARKPITQYKPNGAAAKTIKVVADEMVARIEAAQDAGRTAA